MPKLFPKYALICYRNPNIVIFRKKGVKIIHKGSEKIRMQDILLQCNIHKT